MPIPHCAEDPARCGILQPPALESALCDYFLNIHCLIAEHGKRSR